MCIIQHKFFPLRDRDCKNLEFIVRIAINYAQSSIVYTLQHTMANSLQSLFQAIARVRDETEL
ncbi:hypothetical protein [Scytonema sp. NUACC26]|uniref:hypothetical protein n=1 Tax=Scytonema sp. NUACC26 TaxID=3140176 RepID=UPI0038B30B59